MAVSWVRNGSMEQRLYPGEACRDSPACPRLGGGETLTGGHDPCSSTSGVLAPPLRIALELGKMVGKPCSQAHAAEPPSPSLRQGAQPAVCQDRDSDGTERSIWKAGTPASPSLQMRDGFDIPTAVTWMGPAALIGSMGLIARRRVRWHCEADLR